MAAKLIAEEGPLKGLVLSMENGDQWVIGRDPDVCQLTLEDPSVSRKHILCQTTNKGMVVENLSTTNPIQINEEEIKTSKLLNNGDLIKIGSGTYRFYAEPEAHLFDEDETTNDKPMISIQEPPSEEMTEKADIINPPIAPEAPPQNAQVLPENELKLTEEEPKSLTKEEPKDLSEEELKDSSIFKDDPSESKEDLAEINFNLSESGRWLLKVIGGPNTGAEFSMQTSTSYLIGTDPNTCDIVFHDTSVSRQHARITVGDDDQVSIEDLKSRNGTLIDGESLKVKKTLNSNTVVTIGTTSFIIYDREGEMQTIISPLLPSIVKVLQKEEVKKEDEAPPKPVEEIKKPEENLIKPKEKTRTFSFGAFLLIVIITGLFIIIGIGTTTLFKSEPVISKEQVDYEKILNDAIAPFPNVKYSFNKGTGRLLIAGHVATTTDKNQLMYNLQGMTFIKSIDDSGVVIDEGVWREVNQVIARNPSWKGISIHSPSPGHFVLSGYLQTRKQSEQLWEYISANFPYLDLLEKRITVEEDVIGTINTELYNHGFKDVVPQMSNGEVTLTGTIPIGKTADFNKLIEELKKIQGLRSIKSSAIEVPAEQSLINLSDRYEVTGVSHEGSVNTSVIINGRILTRGDVLDGMTITSIKPNAILLEKDGTKYRIDYNK